MGDFCMPALGAEMEAGTLVRWLVKPGDVVARGDIVAEVETDKANIQVEIFESGEIEELLVPEGERVPVGTALARLASTAAASGARTSAAAGAPEATPVAQQGPPAMPRAEETPVRVQAVPHATPTARKLAEALGIDLTTIRGTGIDGAVTRADVEMVSHATAAEDTDRVRASPLARRLARECGLDLSRIPGTGPGGAITAGDLQGSAAAPSAGPAPTPGALKEVKTDARRRATALAMERSKREIPHYYLGATIDMRNAEDWLRRTNADLPVADRILYAALLMKAVALAAREVPEMNGFWLDGGFRPSKSVHLGVAISLRGGGLVAPAIHDADRLSPGELMAALRDLVSRARAGSLRSSEMSDPTITVTNLGEQGVDTVFPIIFAPQVAIVGFGRIVERPWSVDGMLTVRPVITASLAADHRASDGHRGGLLLRAIERFLMEPESLCQTI